MSASTMKKMASEFVVPRHVCRTPSYITDLDRNSLDDQILRATSTDDLEQLKEWGKTLEDGRNTADVKDPEGRGLLHIAASKGGIGLCTYLIKELEMAIDEKDDENCTPLLYASMKGHLDAAVYLIQKGADPCALQKHNTTALHMSTFSGQIEVMRYLLMKGVDVNTPSHLGTPLQQSNGKVDVVRVLLDHGANPNVFVDYHSTPLEMCLIRGSLESTKLLIEAGADPNGGSGPLAYAAANEGIECIKCLLEAGADPNIQDDARLLQLCLFCAI